MKNKFLFLSSLWLLVLAGCKKDDPTVSVESATAPKLTASTTGPLTLLRANSANPAITFNWTNPDYRFSTGVSSQDVFYTLQTDTVATNGNAFVSGVMQENVIAKDLGVTLTVKELNAILTKMNLTENVPYNMAFRIKASLANGALPLYSDPIKMTVTPYLDAVVAPPASGKLFITGSATPGGWMGGGDPELASQRFTRVSNTEYEIVVPLTANDSYLFVPVYGSWTDKYAFTGAKNANNVNGDSFQAGGEDIKAPAVSGNYKITVNFKLGTFTVVKQ